jgi:hypothetical protein
VTGENGAFHRWSYEEVCESGFSTPPTKIQLNSQVVAWTFNETLTEGLVGTATNTIAYLNLEQNVNVKLVQTTAKGKLLSVAIHQAVKDPQFFITAGQDDVLRVYTSKTSD